MGKTLIILGVQSPICVEVEETCNRLGLSIEAAIRFGAKSRWLDSSVVVSLDKFDSSSARSSFISVAFNPNRRSEIAEIGAKLRLKPSEAVIDPTAIVAGGSRMSQLVFINAAAIIGASTMIQTGALINRAASIGHHCVIGEFASIGPGATVTSSVLIGEGSIVGAGAVICPGVKIGRNSVISAGATVTRNVPDGALIAGPKARCVLNAAHRARFLLGIDE